MESRESEIRRVHRIAKITSTIFMWFCIGYSLLGIVEGQPYIFIGLSAAVAIIFWGASQSLYDETETPTIFSYMIVAGLIGFPLGLIAVGVAFWRAKLRWRTVGHLQ